MKRVTKSYREFWAERMHIRWKAALMAPMDPLDVYRQEAEFLKEVLGLSPGSKALDLGCGAGECCLLLAQQGIQTTGIDVAPVILEHARRRAAELGVPAEFACGDMREHRGDTPFDAVFTSSGTFGMFDDAGDRAVLETIREALVDGGRFLIGPSGPGLLEAESFCQRDWSLVDGGCLLTERAWDCSTSLFRESLRFIDETGALIERGTENEEHWWAPSKVYSIPELEALLAEAGLAVTGMYGSYALPPEPHSEHTPRLLIVGRRA